MSYDSNRRKVEQDLRRKLARATSAVGAFVEGEAKVRAPVRTGALRGSITHKDYGRTGTTVIGTNMHYAVHQEYGTEKMAPQSFLRPAITENKSRIRKLVERAYKW